MFVIPLIAIPLIHSAAPAKVTAVSFFNQPIDAILFDILIWFGWIPIFVTLVWGFVMLWKDYRQGLYSAKQKYVLLAVDVPSATEQTPKALENLFANLYGTKSSLTWKETWIDGKLHPIYSFEIVSTGGYIQFLVRTPTRCRDVVEAGIYAHYPDAQICEVEDYVWNFPNKFPDEKYEMWGTEFFLDRPQIFPIRTYVDFEDKLTQEIKDPLGNTLEQMGRMKPGEHLWFQMLVQPSSNDWQKAAIKFVSKIYGKEEKAKQSFLEKAAQTVMAVPSGLINSAIEVDLNEMIFGSAEAKEDDPWKAFKISLHEKEEAEAVLRKASKVGHGVKIRILYVSEKSVYVKGERTGIVKGILNQYSNLNLNKFALYIPQIPKDDYFWMRWQYTSKQHRLMLGFQKRSWGIGATPFFLNVEEMATLWHFPAVNIKAPLIKKLESKRGEPPVGLPVTFQEDTLPGFNTDVGDESLAEEPSVVLPSPKSDEPLAEALPSPKAPTLGNEKTDDSFAPPNLPV
jgi:uncharacterized glyoxalase superfamily protein PhnB